MNVRPVTDLALYRYRYIIGYALLAILVFSVLLLNFYGLPSGITKQEAASALTSHTINLSFSINNPVQSIINFLQSVNTVDLPYHILQKISLNFFGLSPFGLRLPSIIIAAISAFIIFVLLRRWLFKNAAIVMGVIVATSSWFLAIGRLGTPDIMILFWTALIILLATLISQESKHLHAWKALGLLSIGLSLYTPGMIYLYTAATLAGITQPHLRYVIRYAQKTSVAIGLFLLIVILIPLGYHIWREPTIMRELFAIPVQLPDIASFFSNILGALNNIANPFNTVINTHILPLISIPMVCLTIIGFSRLLADLHSVRSHVLLVWLAILVPVIGLTPPDSVVILFIPLMLLSAIGMQTLIRYWYRLFPRNPYARVFGLLPLSLLVFSIISFNYARYFIAVPYSPSVAKIYDQDAFLLHQALDSKTYRSQRLIIVASPEQAALYSINKSIAKNTEVITPKDFSQTNNATSIIVAESEQKNLSEAQRALLPTTKSELLVSNRKDNSLRFRVYSQQ